MQPLPKECQECCVVNVLEPMRSSKMYMTDSFVECSTIPDCVKLFEGSKLIPAAQSPRWNELRLLKVGTDGGSKAVLGGCKLLHTPRQYWLIVELLYLLPLLFALVYISLVVLA